MNLQESQPASAGRLFDAVAWGTEWLGRLSLVILVLLVIAEATSRSLANFSFGFAEEVTGYLVVALTLFGAARALRAGSLFEVGFILGRCRGRLRFMLRLFYIVVSIVVCVVLAMKSSDLVLSSLSRGKFAPTVLHTPLWIPQLLLPIGFSVLVLFLLEKLLLLFADSRAGRN